MAVKAWARSLGRNGIAAAAVALCIGAGGTAVAAQMVTGKVVKNNSLTGIDIRNKSLTKKDFRGSIRGARGPQGPAWRSGRNGSDRGDRRGGCHERGGPPGLADELQRCRARCGDGVLSAG